MTSHPFVILYLIGVFAAWLVRATQTRGYQRNAKSSIPALELGLMLVWFVASQVLPAIYLFAGLWSFADYPLPVAIAIAGISIFLLALWLLWRSHADLGANWSPIAEIQPEQTLVTRGVYRYLRHPMYSAHVLWGLAQALLIPNWLVGWAGVVTFLMLYAVRVPGEEALMRDRFGAEYEAYQQTAGAIVPRLARR